MRLIFARIHPRRRATSPADDLIRLYFDRIRHPNDVKTKDFHDEAAFAAAWRQAAARARTPLLLAHSEGRQLTSEAISDALSRLADTAATTIWCAVGPPDGWSGALLGQADLTIAFGRITLPHELAAAVFAEQLYRATTILAGHPYHLGH